MQLKGIDVSKHQGIIDWNKVKADGIQFAMIRLGYGWQHLDPQFERNVNECKRLGIKWGVYFYSYALNTHHAKIEAEFVIKHLKGKNPDFPVAFDMEDADSYKESNGMPSNKTLVDICYTFLDTVEKQGYYVSLYASKSWLDNQLNSRKLDRFDKWVAQWANKCTYVGSYQMWQYTSKGRVNGIRGNVDMNIAYSDFNFKNKTQPKQNYKMHTIKSGENLTYLAVKYKTTVNELLKLNPKIKNKDYIYAGDTITVPNN